MNRAVCQARFGGEPAQVLELLHKEIKPRAAPGRVVVKLTARPVHPFDLHLVRKCHFAHLSGRDVTIGSEGAGVVEEVGEGVTKVKPGQRVAPWLLKEYLVTGQGSWQDYVDVPEKYVFPVPENLSDEAAAQMLCNPATLYGLLEELSVPRGEYLLQTAAGSVLGRQVIQLAKHRGIKTINIVRRDEVKEELEALGADEVINSTNEDVVARVQEITRGKLAYGSIDAVAGSLVKDVMACTRDGGDVLIYGALGGSFDAVVGLHDLARNVRVRLWSVLNSYFTKDEERTQRGFEEIIQLQAEKVIEPLVGRSFPLSKFKLAIEESKKVGRGGKIILVN